MPEATLYVMANAYSIDLEAAVKLMPGKNTVYVTAINKHFFTFLSYLSEPIAQLVEDYNGIAVYLCYKAVVQTLKVLQVFSDSQHNYGPPIIISSLPAYS